MSEIRIQLIEKLKILEEEISNGDVPIFIAILTIDTLKETIDFLVNNVERIESDKLLEQMKYDTKWLTNADKTRLLEWIIVSLRTQFEYAEWEDLALHS